jgi:hypothetical protein
VARLGPDRHQRASVEASSQIPVEGAQAGLESVVGGHLGRADALEQSTLGVQRVLKRARGVSATARSSSLGKLPGCAQERGLRVSRPRGRFERGADRAHDRAPGGQGARGA